MKKLLSIILTIILLITLATGCTQKSTETANETKPLILKDGTYSSVGQADQNGWIPEMTMTITNGKITAVAYDEMTAMKKSEHVEYQKNWNAQGEIDLLALYKTMQSSLIKTQDPTKLDTISGATKALENFKILSTEALKDAKADNQYKDGTYFKAGAKDEKNWTPMVAITIKAGKITSVKYDEVSSKVFKYKSHDNSYLKKFKEKNNLDLIAVYDAYQKTLIEKQVPSKVDSIAGATQTHDKFVAVASQALEQAK